MVSSLVQICRYLVLSVHLYPLQNLSSILPGDLQPSYSLPILISISSSQRIHLVLPGFPILGTQPENSHGYKLRQLQSSFSLFPASQGSLIFLACWPSNCCFIYFLKFFSCFTQDKAGSRSQHMILMIKVTTKIHYLIYIYMIEQLIEIVL